MPKPFRAAGSRVLAVVATVVTAAAVTVVGAAPAQAAVPTMRTGTSVTDDYAYAEIYNMGFDRHGVYTSGAVWDRCGADGKGDGAGAYVRGRVRFGNGTWSGWSSWAGDSSGCGNAGSTWGHVLDFPNRTVTDLQLQLCERDDGVRIECTRRTFDNPRVAG